MVQMMRVKRCTVYSAILSSNTVTMKHIKLNKNKMRVFLVLVTVILVQKGNHINYPLVTLKVAHYFQTSKILHQLNQNNPFILATGQLPVYLTELYPQQ